MGCVDSPQTFRSAVASAPCSHQFAAPPPQYTSKNHLEHSEKTLQATPKARSHSRGQERATASQDTHSTGAPRPRRSRTSGLLLLREKATKIGSLAPPQVASLINTQPTQRLHHQATGLRGNILCSPVWPSYFSLLFTSYHRFTRLPSPSLLFPFIPTGAPQTDEESTYKHHQPGNPKIWTATTVSRAPPFL